MVSVPLVLVLCVIQLKALELYANLVLGVLLVLILLVKTRHYLNHSLLQHYLVNEQGLSWTLLGLKVLSKFIKALLEGST